MLKGGKPVLVIGGGITGLTAALAGADAGYEVLIVEKEPLLGGFMATLKRGIPHHPLYTEPVVASLTDTILSVAAHPKIQTLTSAQISKLEGQPGMFNVTVVAEGRESNHQLGAVVLATGWKPYDATRLKHLGYGLTPDVITGVELERLAAAGPIVRPSNGRPRACCSCSVRVPEKRSTFLTVLRFAAWQL